MRRKAQRIEDCDHLKSMQLLLNETIYQKVIVELLPQARRFLWIVTADIKDLHVPVSGVIESR